MHFGYSVTNRASSIAFKVTLLTLARQRRKQMTAEFLKDEWQYMFHMMPNEVSSVDTKSLES